MARNPRLILIDIRGHLLAIVRASAGMHKEDFQAAPKEYQDCLHHLVNVAHAVNQLPPDITARHPEVPWSSFARFGTFLSRRPERHVRDAAWDTVTIHVPLLRAAVRALLEPQQGSFD